jgi:hypothetical protein
MTDATKFPATDALQRFKAEVVSEQTNGQTD